MSDPTPQSLLAEARILHSQGPAIDLHADTPKLVDRAGYDLFRRHEPPLPKSAWLGHVDIPRMHEGGLAAQFFSLWTFPMPERGCTRGVLRQIEAVERAAQRRPDALTICRSAEEIESTHAAGRAAGLFGIEGAHALEGQVDRVAMFAARGVRYIGLLHFSRNALGWPAAGWGKDDARGLTPFGHQVIEAMDHHGVIVDLAHINQRGFDDAVRATRSIPMVTHAGVVGANPHWRNLTDDQLRQIANRGGCVGVIFAPFYLGKDGIDAVCDHLDHMARVAGDDLVALGSDYDGMVVPPKGLEDVSKLPHLTAALLRRKWSPERIRKLLGENVLRVLRGVPPKQSSLPAS